MVTSFPKKRRKGNLYEEFKKINQKYKDYRVDISAKGLDKLNSKEILLTI